MNQKRFITEEVQKTIEETVKKAEEKTSGEIVTMIVPASDSYLGAAWYWGFFLCLVMTFCFYLLFPSLKFSYYLLAEIPLMVASFLIFQIPFLKRLCILSQELEEEVFQRAIEAFYKHQLHSTRDRNGILIFVSLFERRVQILADMGIHQKVPVGTWDAVVQHLTLDIQNHRIQEGFVKAIETCGEVLSQYFPKKFDDRNELKDTLRTQ